MKNLLALVIIILMSFSSSGQVLKPRLLQEGKDTLFCFTIPQAKIIAGMVSNGQYCDSLSENQSRIILQQDTLNLFYKKQLSLLQKIIVNDNSIMANYETTMGLMKSDLDSANKKVKKLKRHRWLFLAGGLIGGFAIGHL